MHQTKCDHCPLRDRPEGCPAIVNPHPKFCDQVNPDHPEFNPHMAGPILAMAGVASAIASTAPGPVAQRVEATINRRPIEQGVAPEVPPAIDPRLLPELSPEAMTEFGQRLAACPHRSVSCGCQPGFGACAIDPRGPNAVVGLRDCAACLGFLDAGAQAEQGAGVECTGRSDDYPSLGRQAGNLAGSLVRFAASGLAVADDAAVAARLAACRACDRFDAGPGRCRECGCFVAIKIRAASEACPLGKWDRLP